MSSDPREGARRAAVRSAADLLRFRSVAAQTGCDLTYDMMPMAAWGAYPQAKEPDPDSAPSRASARGRDDGRRM